MLNPFYCVDDSNSKNKVKSYTLKKLFSEYNLLEIDFLKMDIEGAEASIFENDCTWLRSVKSINIEVHNNSLAKCIGILEEFGFKCEISKKHWSAVLAYK